MYKKILVVCLANICRSPIGEALLKKKLDGSISVASAGVATERYGLQGYKADPMAIEVSNINGLDISRHKAKQLTSEIAAMYDLILVMEPDLVGLVTEIAPSSGHKILQFGQWTHGSIADPFSKEFEAFERVFFELNTSAERWASKLS